MLESVVNQKGQITIPAELRRRLNLRPGDRVTLSVDDNAPNSVIMRPVTTVAARTYGIAPRRVEPVDLDEASRQYANSRVAKYTGVNLDDRNRRDSDHTATADSNE